MLKFGSSEHHKELPHTHNHNNKVEKIITKKKDLKPKYIPMSKMFHNVKKGKDIKIKMKTNDPLETYGKSIYQEKFEQMGLHHHKTMMNRF
jgi:hypothetical protein